MNNRFGSDYVPAFPQLGFATTERFDELRGRSVDTERLFTNGGMELRDYFAAQALLASMVMASSRGLPAIDMQPLIEGIANAAYAIADAMMKERSKS